MASTKFYYLSPVGRKGLDDYKYVSGSSTFLDRLMNKFWEFSITLVPLWIAPNMITLMGLSVNLLGCALMLWYSPKLGRLYYDNLADCRACALST